MGKLLSLLLALWKLIRAIKGAQRQAEPHEHVSGPDAAAPVAPPKKKGKRVYDFETNEWK